MAFQDPIPENPKPPRSFQIHLAGGGVCRGVLHKKHMAVTNEGLLLGRLGRGYEELSPSMSNTTH